MVTYRLNGILAALLVAAINSTSLAADQGKVLEELQRLEQQFGGHLGVMARNLATGEAVGYNSAERFPTASAIKLPVMAAFFYLADRKSVDPGEKVVLSGEDRKAGSGILQFMSPGTTLTLLDAVKLMIILSDNTATNLVLDRLGDSHETRMRAVNDFLMAKGLKNTRILNRLYTWQTKLRTPEAIRYGIGVSTPEDMVSLLEALYEGTLVDSASCRAMLDILKLQSDHDMIPRLLPQEECTYFETAHKTGAVNETKVDVGLVLSDKINIALAIFVDKHPDHRDGVDNKAVQLAAHVSRAIWNYFTGGSGYHDRKVVASDVDWNTFPGGRWAIYRSSFAPFPHKERFEGFRGSDGTVYPYDPHYADSSITVFVPEGFTETPHGTNLIVHFHGHANDNMGVLEKYGMPQAMIAQKVNALLILPQGPYRARDSFGGKMEDTEGFKRMVDDVLATMRREGVLSTVAINNIIVSAHSGGYRPAAYVLDRGGLTDHVTDVFLFDAFYGEHEFYRKWLTAGRGVLRGAYTDHLADEHEKFEGSIAGEPRSRLHFERTTVAHEEVVQSFFPDWLARLGQDWKIARQ
jgi:beta-lactamase class A